MIWGDFGGAKVLLLGTGRHLPVADSRLPGVPAVETTLYDLKKTLVDRCKLPDESITIKLNPASVEEIGAAVADATRSAVDLLVVYYVGHGVLTASGQLHLATSGTRAVGDHVSYTALPYGVVGNLIRRSQATHRVVILDCCFSARALDGPSGLGEPDDVADQTQIPGGFVLTSASRYEASLAPMGSRHTAFSGALMRLLRDGDPTYPATWAMGSLTRGLVRAMEDRHLPVPRYRADGDLADLAIAPNVAFRAATHTTATPSSRGGNSIGAAGLCPYPGLAAFDVSDARWFHGRAQLIEKLIRGLARSYDGPSYPLAVIGASGAGKTSLLRAGLIPAVTEGALGIAGSNRWPILFIPVTENPLIALASQISSLIGIRPELIIKEIRNNPNAITRLLQSSLLDHTIRDHSKQARVVMILDQLEDTLLPQELDSSSSLTQDLALFGSAINIAASNDRGSPPALIVMAMRSDSYGQIASQPIFHSITSEAPLIVSAMTPLDVMSAIQEPAHAAGLNFEDGLVELLMADLGVSLGSDVIAYEAGRLPLLSHALRTLWQNREGDSLTLAGYQRSGGISRALSNTADKVLSGISRQYGNAGKTTAEEILIRLVHVARNSDMARLHIPRNRLLNGLPGNAPRILHDLCNDQARLLTTAGGPEGRDTVEIIHESLLREWPRLNQLLEKHKGDLIAEGEIRAAAERWVDHGKNVSDLYLNDALAASRRRFGSPQQRARLSADTIAYIEASIHHERRRRRVRLISSMAVAAAMVLALTGTTVAAWQWRAATLAQKVVIQRQLSSQASQLLATLANQESAMRAYAISGTRDALKTYNNEFSRERQIFSEMRLALRNSPTTLELLNKVETAADLWREEVARPVIDAIRLQGKDSGQALVEASTHTVFDDVREAITNLQNEISK
ncbi:CHASE3 domain-containing protein [Actinoplanes sp. N902-109]|uniref:caspase, EACC1-associated type n=1 Tax=Actinoplanes sp. (strain N902-109) TaxID=649831 RepID=UPI0018DBBC7C|nr:CHASE3 domain-containing protein [Actinoplanes sp. N902-109]